jgi:hypothetical protein
MTVGPPDRPLRRAALVPRRAQLGWCGLLVVCAHVAVLAMPQRTIGGGQPTVDPIRTVQLRMIPAVSGRAQPDPHPPVAVAVQQHPLQAAAHAPGPRETRQAKKPALPSPIQSSEAGDIRPTMRVTDERDSDYLPRSALSVAPRAVGQISIDYPRFDGEADQYTGEFEVFIDDTGGVVRVTNATPELPRILANAVREAFLAARFSPGEVAGHPVRSRMRIEVTFDSRRLPSS